MRIASAASSRPARQLLAYTVVAASLRGAVGASTSMQCRAGLDAMLKDENWVWVNTSYTRWCRIRLENEMAQCCGVGDFEKGRAEGCSECSANCVYVPMDRLCSKYFGKACKVNRKPFYRTGAKGLEVEESFCVPYDCDNPADRSVLMTWYSATYKARRGGWHRDWDEAELLCPDSIIQSIVYTLLAIVGFFILVKVYIFLRWAPKEPGRTLDVAMDEGDDLGGTQEKDMLRDAGDTWGSDQYQLQPS